MNDSARPDRPYAPDVVRRQAVLEEHDPSPDGRFAVVVRRHVDGLRYGSHLWLVPLTGHGRPRRLTEGRVRDTAPRFRPDGRAIAFRRHRLDEERHERGLMVLPLSPDGVPGEPWQVLDRTHGIGAIEWSPDGRSLAFTGEVDPPRFIVGEPRGTTGAEEEATEGTRSVAGAEVRSPVARRIRRVDWRYDEEGHLDRWEHLHAVAVRRGGRARQLTHGDHGVSGIAWMPDGGSILYVADPRPDGDLRPRTSIWQVPATGGDPVEVLALGGNVYSPAVSPDGRWLAAVGVVDAEALDDVSPELVLAPLEAGPAAGGGGGGNGGGEDGRPAQGAPSQGAAVHGGRVHRLAPELDRPIGAWHDSDLNGWMTSGQSRPTWNGPAELIALVTDRGRTVPWRIAIDPATGEAAGAPRPMVDGPSADAACWTLAVSVGRVTALGVLGGRAQELLVVEPGGTAPGRTGPRGTDQGRTAPGATEQGRPQPRGPLRAPGATASFRILTTLGSGWQRGRIAPEMRRLDAPGEGGPIETWVASPPGAGEAPLPTVVDVHGGPLGAWAPTPSLEVLLLVSRGYRVVLPNIRGSTSYGRAWIRPQLGDWGGVDAADVHAALDQVVALGLADPSRLGVLGLSYGGFMVHWLIGTSDRFRAAVSENGVANQVSAWANSDTGAEYCRTSLLGDPLTPEGVEKLWRQSPLRHVAAIRTPLLMLQAEADRRCPAADNEQLFIALRLLGREVEYVLYPDEYHVYATTGRPDRRIDRMTRMLDWFDRHLKG